MTTLVKSVRNLDGAGAVPKDKGKKKPSRAERALYVELDPLLRKACNQAVKQERRDLTTIVSMALEKHLTDLGLWPPVEGEED